jgi:hypothetical protein
LCVAGWLGRQTHHFDLVNHVASGGRGHDLKLSDDKVEHPGSGAVEWKVPVNAGTEIGSNGVAKELPRKCVILLIHFAGGGFDERIEDNNLLVGDASPIGEEIPFDGVRDGLRMVVDVGQNDGRGLHSRDKDKRNGFRSVVRHVDLDVVEPSREGNGRSRSFVNPLCFFQGFDAFGFDAHDVTDVFEGSRGHGRGRTPNVIARVHSSSGVPHYLGSVRLDSSNAVGDCPC